MRSLGIKLIALLLYTPLLCLCTQTSFAAESSNFDSRANSLGRQFYSNSESIEYPSYSEKQVQSQDKNDDKNQDEESTILNLNNVIKTDNSTENKQLKLDKEESKIKNDKDKEDVSNIKYNEEFDEFNEKPLKTNKSNQHGYTKDQFESMEKLIPTLKSPDNAFNGNKGLGISNDEDNDLETQVSQSNDNKEKLDRITKGSIIFQEVRFKDLKQWNNDNHIESLPAFLKSCSAFKRGKPVKSKLIYFGDIINWLAVCNKAANVQDEKSATDFFEKNFKIYNIYKRANFRTDNIGLFTGYYEIVVRGSRKKTGRYKYPIYKFPKYSTSHYTRAQISNGALDGKGLEIFWVDDLIDLYLLHIQGSGIIEFDDKSTTRVGYDGTNSKTYVSMSDCIRKSGILKKERFSNMMDWLRNHPEQAMHILNKNPSYIFFKENNSTKGPIGAQGVELTPERSLAVDGDFIGFGLPIWLETKIVNRNVETKDYIDFHKLLVAQDAGSAITGVIRGDIFFGSGKEAKHLAEKMQFKGSYYIMIPRDADIR